MKGMGVLDYCLGVTAVQDEMFILATPEAYILSMLQKFGLTGAKLVSTSKASFNPSRCKCPTIKMMELAEN